MPSCLADVNVLVALLAEDHPHHRLAREWYAGMDVGEVGICRQAWLGSIRLLTTRAVMGDEYVLTAREALATVELLLADQRCEFLPEPEGLAPVMAEFFTYRVPTPRLVSDAYLAAFARQSGRTLVTFDQGFRQYQGLQVQILAG